MIKAFELEDQWKYRMENHELALRMTNRGVLIDKDLRIKMSFEIAEQSQNIKRWLESIAPQEGRLRPCGPTRAAGAGRPWL